MKIELNNEISFVNLKTNKTYVVSIHKKDMEYVVVRRWTIPETDELGVTADIFKTLENAIGFFLRHLSEREKNGYTFLMERKNVAMPNVEIKKKVATMPIIKKECEPDPRHVNAKPHMTGEDIEKELKRRQANMNSFHNLIKY